MKIYNYDGETGEYLSSSTATESPLERGVYLIPANATDIKPPSKSKNSAHIFIDGEWASSPDYRGEVYYSTETGSQVTSISLGWEPVEDSHTTKKKVDELTTWENGDWVIDADKEVISGILALEGEVTPRRIREALISESGRAWVENLDKDIQKLRTNLSKAVT
tara:strand:+ start:1783 stop:2274 length:492 start_codon:yes stop_codon:yes gene_type:complete